jgi:hypothetical protein
MKGIDVGRRREEIARDCVKWNDVTQDTYHWMEHF